MGVYRPVVKEKDGTKREIQVWWLSYHSRGRRIRESAQTTKKMVAEALLRQRLGEVAAGKTPGMYLDRVTFSDLAAGYLCEHPEPQDKADPNFERQHKACRGAKNSVSHLARFFNGFRANDIDTAHVWQYREARRTDGAKDSSINRELAALKRMFNLARQCNPPKVDHVPHIPMVQERNVRKGFFEHVEFLALRDALPEYLRGFVTFAYRSGWRKGEIANLQWKQVDRTGGIITLDPGQTKNDEGRTLYLDDELRAVIDWQYNLRLQSGKVLPYVFLNEGGTDKIKDFRKTWRRACKIAGIVPKLFHDLRRTACRDMVRAGIPERVAMMISGHKTRSVFDRYNIVSDADLREAVLKRVAYHNGQEASTSTKQGQIVNIRMKRQATGKV